jgi:hypothetical protein
LASKSPDSEVSLELLSSRVSEELSDAVHSSQASMILIMSLATLGVWTYLRILSLPCIESFLWHNFAIVLARVSNLNRASELEFTFPTSFPEIIQRILWRRPSARSSSSPPLHGGLEKQSARGVVAPIPRGSKPITS